MAVYMTEQRRALTRFFEKRRDQSFTAKQIFEQLEDTGVSLSAVYRNLNALEKEGKLVRVGSDRYGETSYRYTACEQCRKKIHLSCRKCGKTYHLEPSAARELVDTVALSNGFMVDENETVLYGLCLSCADKGKEGNI